MTEYRDASHPTWFWTCQALWPAHTKQGQPEWRACFFDGTKEGATRSMAWALDQEEGTYARALDFRVMPPTLERPTAGAPWDPVSSRRKAAKALVASVKVAQERQARLSPPPRPEKPAKAVLARPAATPAPRQRAAERFRAAAKAKKGKK